MAPGGHGQQPYSRGTSPQAATQRFETKHSGGHWLPPPLPPDAVPELPALPPDPPAALPADPPDPLPELSTAASDVPPPEPVFPPQPTSTVSTAAGAQRK